ncbi:unnamed protein product [marine sediment metagenome]|uniref:Uncharacterized protein n=1 Tax=marine sediment metagenome TaxID=412755 RepID=X1PED1_9ZZZZ
MKVSPELAGKGVGLLRVLEVLLKPTDPKEGPPVPDSWDISWPGFIMRGIKRLKEEPPWETIPKYGLREELKREFEVVTGQKLD